MILTEDKSGLAITCQSILLDEESQRDVSRNLVRVDKLGRSRAFGIGCVGRFRLVVIFAFYHRRRGIGALFVRLVRQIKFAI